MGRRNIIPSDYDGEKLHLRQVPIRQGYDPGGAYWGQSIPLWCAWGESATEQMEVYVRATNRRAAKVAVGEALTLQCNPTFHH
jgi:hypothetical protein